MFENLVKIYRLPRRQRRLYHCTHPTAPTKNYTTMIDCQHLQHYHVLSHTSNQQRPLVYRQIISLSTLHSKTGWPNASHYEMRWDQKAILSVGYKTKKHRTPLEERVLALSESNIQENNIQITGIQAEKRSTTESKHPRVLSHSRSDVTKHKQQTGISRARSMAADTRKHPPEGQTSSHDRPIFRAKSTDRSVSHEVPAGINIVVSAVEPHTGAVSAATDAVNLSENQNLSPKTSKSTGLLTSGESPTSELVSIVDEYLKQRRIRLLDLFRCVDVARSGSSSRQDFRYLLKEAKVPLTQAQVEQLADSLSVDGHSDCVGYSQLLVAMNRHSEIKQFRKRRPDQLQRVDWQSSLTIDVSDFGSSLTIGDASDAAEAAAPICPEVRKNEKAPCEDQKRSYCRRVLKLFRDNALFGEVAGRKRKSPSSARGDVRELKSTMDADKGLATRLEEVRLHDRIEYEATRDAVRRHRLPVRGRALRHGLLTATDRPRSAIDVRRLPRAHMLTAHGDDRHREMRITTHFGSGDSLDKEIEEDECRSTADTSRASGSRFGLRVQSAASSRQLHSASSSRQSAYDKWSRQGSGEGGDSDEEEEEQEEEEEEDGRGGKRKTGRAGDRGSTRARGRTGKPRTRHDDLESRRKLRELEERARKNAKYWPGRADNVLVYREEGERGGHPIFERVGQTWYNDDPRYLINRCDEEIVNRYNCRRSPEKQQPRWAWQRTVEYGIVGPSSVYRCVPFNASTRVRRPQTAKEPHC